MNVQLAQFFISVAGVIIMLLLAAIAYFLQKWINSTDMLTESVHELKTAVALLQTNQGNAGRMCSTAHKIIDTKLENVAKSLIEHGEAIVELQSATRKTRNPKPATRNNSNHG